VSLKRQGPALKNVFADQAGVVVIERRPLIDERMNSGAKSP